MQGVESMIKNTILIVGILFLATLGGTRLAQRYSWDITQNNSNTLKQQSMQLLDALDAPITLTVYSPDMEVLNTCDIILTMYKNYSSKVSVAQQQTILDPIQAAKLKVTSDHILVVNYKDVQQALEIRLNEFNEPQVSALIQNALNYANNWLVFLTGHEEGDPLNTGEFGLSGFAKLFAQQGMNVVTLNLAQQEFIPQNTAVLIVANPQQDFLPKEKALLHQYIGNGGKLIWFTEPDAPITAFVMEEFGVKPAKGVAIDPESSKLGSPHPALKIITQYPNHDITKDVTSATVFPWSGHLQILYQAGDWEPTPFLTTGSNTWTYSGLATRDIEILSKYQDITGPLNIGIAFTRQKEHAKNEQRALVIADSSFLINKYLPLYANSQLATNVVAWTQNNSQVYIFNTPPLKDLSYHPSTVYRFTYQYIFTLAIPLFFIGIGFYLGRNWPNLRFRFKI